jgi:hypothetical protein
MGEGTLFETGMPCCRDTSGCSTLLPARSQKRLEWPMILHPKQRLKGRKQEHTFSIALLVRTPLNPFFPFLPLRIDALFRDAVFDTAETRSCIVAFLAGFLAVGACVLDLSTLRTKRLSRQKVRSERVHVHRVPYGRHRYGEGSWVARMRVIKGIVAIGALVISGSHEIGIQKLRL